MNATPRPRWRAGIATALVAVLAVACAVVAGPTPAVQAATGELVVDGTFSAPIANIWFFPSQGGVENCCAAPPGSYPNAFLHPDGLGSGTSLNGYVAGWTNIANPPAGSYTLSGKIRTSGGVQQASIQADNGVFDNRYCRITPTNTPCGTPSPARSASPRPARRCTWRWRPRTW